LSGGVSFWTGLNDVEQWHVEGVFKWGNSPYPVVYQNLRDLDCVASDAMGWHMAISGCASAQLPFICKMSAEAATPGSAKYWAISLDNYDIDY